MYRVTTSGVCAKEIMFELEGETIKNVTFIGGCPGNAIGLSNMLEGENAHTVIEKLKHVKCGGKSTSCPSQLAMALANVLG